MSNTDAANTVNTETVAAPAFKMSIDETVKMLQNYSVQADNSLTQLQTNIDNATNQLNEWKRMQLMIMGQRQLINDIISKTVVTPNDITSAVVSDSAAK